MLYFIKRECGHVLFLFLNEKVSFLKLLFCVFQMQRIYVIKYMYVYGDPGPWSEVKSTKF